MQIAILCKKVVYIFIDLMKYHDFMISMKKQLASFLIKQNALSGLIYRHVFIYSFIQSIGKNT